MNSIRPNISEEEMIVLLQQKQESGLRALYQQKGGLLFGVISKIVKAEDLAENVLQEVFVKIWDNIDSYKPYKGRFLSWACQIARNAALDFIRSKTQQKSAKVVPIQEALLENPKTAQYPKIEHIGLKETVAKLGNKYKRIIELIYFEGYTQSEVAKELDMPLGTVKSRVKKAFENLRIMLRD